MRALLIVAVALGLISAAPPPAPPARIVAVGDLHGDFDSWRAIALDAGLINAKGKWTGGKTVLVQDGDVPNRGPDSKLIIDDLMRLEREAKKAGGAVVAIVGNHEAMMMTGDFRYVSKGEDAAFADSGSANRRDAMFDSHRDAFLAYYRKGDPSLSIAAARDKFRAEYPLGRIELQQAWAPSGPIGQWVMGHPAVAIVGDTLFVHGGISPAYAAVPIDQIDARVSAALKAGDLSTTSIIDDPAGPLWYRGLAAAQPGMPPIADQITAILAATGAKRIVIAHTPDTSGIHSYADGRLWRIDTGISRIYGGPVSWLDIQGDAVTPHTVVRPPPSAHWSLK